MAKGIAREGYQDGDKCHTCGRTVESIACSVCDGDGKSKGPWGSQTSRCPACSGTGKSIACPIGRYVSLGDHFAGLDCRHFDYVDEKWTKLKKPLKRAS